MFPKLNLQYLISYLGLLPFISIIINKYFLFQFSREISENFTVYYTIIIIVFIGAINWNLLDNVSNLKVLYGFISSLFGLFIIILNLSNINFNLIVIILIFFLFFQIVFEYFFIYLNIFNNLSFFLLRIPLTIMISISLFLIKY